MSSCSARSLWPASRALLSIDRRTGRAMGAEQWHRLAARTSLSPCAALIDGRWRPDLRRLSWRRLALATLVYGGLIALHQPLIGVSPRPATPEIGHSKSTTRLGVSGAPV
jgi:uncharacterized membrane protein